MKLDVRKILYLANCNQNELAEKLGVSKVSIYFWKTGKHFPKGSMVEKIEQITNQKIQNLIK